MREILFRGKRVDNGTWAYGDLTHCDDEMEINSESHGENGGYIIPETIGQYTGLKDKNGVKIFEGDILSGHLDDLFPEDESRYPVVWHDYGWHIKCGNKSFDTLEQWWVAKFLEVIGNLHDNPELLERGAENE